MFTFRGSFTKLVASAVVLEDKKYLIFQICSGHTVREGVTQQLHGPNFTQF